MLINKDHAAHLLELYTEQNGQAYTEKDPAKAIREAKAQLFKEAKDQLEWILGELEAGEIARLNEWYNADDKKEQEAKARKELFEALSKGETVECSEDFYFEQLECLPPVKMDSKGFISGEPYTHKGGEPVYLCFKRTSNGIVCKYLTVKEYDTF